MHYVPHTYSLILSHSTGPHARIKARREVFQRVGIETIFGFGSFQIIEGDGTLVEIIDHNIIPFLQPLLYNYVGTSTRDEDRDKHHKLDHDL